MEKQEKVTEYKEYDVHESVPEADRHYTFKDMAATWTVANANPTSWYVGCTLGALGFGTAIAATLAGNIATYIILALVGLMGYKIGTSNMGLARVPFGIVGSKGPSVVNALQFVGWCGVNTYIAAIPLSHLLHQLLSLPAYGTEGSLGTMALSIVFIMAVTAAIALIGGSRTIKVAENIAVICLIILSIWITVRIFQSFSFENIRQWTPPADIHMPFGQAIDALAALGFAWVMAVAEFFRLASPL